MKNYRKHIDDFFREKLGNYTEIPPADVWDGLSERLDGMQPPTTGFPSRLLVHVSIASLLVILGVSLLRKTNGTAITPSENPIARAAQASASPSNGNQQQGIKSAISASGTTVNTGSIAGANGSVSDAATTTSHELPSATPRNSRAAVTTAATTKGKRAADRGKFAGTKPGHSASIGGYASSQTGSSLTTPNNYGKGPNATTGQDISGDQPLSDQTSKTNSAATTPAKNTPSNLNSEPEPKVVTKKSEKVANPIDEFKRFEIGVKLGYEKGSDEGSASKYVVSPYLQYNINRKFALMVQPAIKAASTSSLNIGSDQTAYQTTNNGQITKVGDTWVTNSIGTTTYYAHTTTYNYAQGFSSIVKNYSYGGHYTEFELPILLKYQLVHHLAAYGGVTLNYSQLIGLTQQSSTNSVTVSKNVTDTITNLSPGTPAPARLPISAVISAPNSDAKSAVITTPHGDLLRCGYMIGFSYEYGKRWLFDGLIEQTPVKSNIQGSDNLNTPFSSTYIRLTIGFKIIQ